MCELKFLKLKNKMFFNSVKELIESKWKFQVELWLEDNGREYVYDIIKNREKHKYFGYGDYTLFSLKFIDEGNYNRTLTIPFEVLFYNKTKGAKIFKEYILENIFNDELFIVKDRQEYPTNRIAFQEEEEENLEEQEKQKRKEDEKKEDKKKKERIKKEEIIKNYESTLYSAINKAVDITMGVDNEFFSEIYMDIINGEVSATEMMGDDDYDLGYAIKSLCIVKGWSPYENIKEGSKFIIEEEIEKKEQRIIEEIKEEMSNNKW